MIKISEGAGFAHSWHAITADFSRASGEARRATRRRVHVGMRPAMAVKEGDRVKKGQILFEDKKDPWRLLYRPGERDRQRDPPRRTARVAVGGD